MAQFDSAIVINNIKYALKLAELTGKRLAELTGVHQNTITNIMKSKTQISLDILKKIAEAVNQPITFFFNDNSPKGLLFRATMDAKLTEKKQFLLLKEFENLVFLRDKALNKISVDFPPERKIHSVEINEEVKSQIREIALNLRKEWNLGLQPIANIIETAQEHDIFVYPFNDKDSKFKACSAYDQNNGMIIFFNNNPSIIFEDRIFTIAHELGHLIFHREDYKNNPTNLGSRDLREKVCNYFASYFLMPEHAFNSFVKQNSPLSLDAIKQFCKIWKFAIKAFFYRLNSDIKEFKTMEWPYITNILKQNYKLPNPSFFNKDEEYFEVNTKDKYLGIALRNESITLSKAKEITGYDFDRLIKIKGSVVF